MSIMDIIYGQCEFSVLEVDVTLNLAYFLICGSSCNFRSCRPGLCNCVTLCGIHYTFLNILQKNKCKYIGQEILSI